MVTLADRQYTLDFFEEKKQECIIPLPPDIQKKILENNHSVKDCSPGIVTRHSGRNKT